jgi:hypothetical protein
MYHKRHHQRRIRFGNAGRATTGLIGRRDGEPQQDFQTSETIEN